LHRLDQEIRHLHLQQAARHLGIEGLRHHHNRRPGADPEHQALERLHLFLAIGVEIDDRDGRVVDFEPITGGRNRAGDDPQIDLPAGPEGRSHGLLERGIRRQHHHAGLVRRA
jgi:hypothetical protein